MKTVKGLQKTKFSRKGKSEAGITLIALVITIILLIILAGVSVASITGENGIIANARNAQTETKRAEEREQIILAYNAALTTQYANATYSASEGISADALKEQLVTNQEQAATVEAGDTADTIKVTFTDSSNSYTVDSKKGTTTFVKPEPTV